MKKIIQRTAANQRQAKRKSEALAKAVAKAEFIKYREEFSMRKKEKMELQKKARAAYREDWRLGPLAPRRHELDYDKTYGAVGINVAMYPVKPKSMRWKDYHIRVGDRVAITNGYQMGKIGIVREVRDEGEYAFVEGLRMTDLIIPEWQRIGSNDPSPWRTHETPIRLSNLRLIFAMTDPNTGVKRDVVVERMEVRRIGDGPDDLERRIPDTDIIIPYPPKHEADAPKNADDTTVASVEERTWIPELLSAPIPNGLIDELRNPYSRFRTRHDDDFVARKQAEDELADRESTSSRNSMRTPQQELRLLAQRKQATAEPAVLSDDVLSRIGAMMVSNGVTRVKGPGK